FPIAGWGGVQHLALPALTLSLPPAAYIARLTRFGMIEQLNADYVRTARAKGLPEHRIVIKHSLKNAFLPVLSYLGPAAAAAMTGSFVVEKVFAVPGVGQHFVDAVISKDLTLIMGVVLTYSTMLILFNLTVDVLYRWVDPRIELS
ncbi:MAG: ABC transporter permease, partial [Phycisphaerales bacterium]|nr:ABC transporter permease [Phycisphaerales bacterium]